MRLVESTISVLGFPRRLEELEGFFYEGDDREWTTSIDLLIGSAGCVDPDLIWTAPKWMTARDLLFMYDAKSAGRSVRRLLREMRDLDGAVNRNVRPQVAGLTGQDSISLRKLVHMLERANVQSEKYSGTIFGCAEISGAAEYYADDDVERHYSGRSSVPLGQVHIFDRPLPAEELADFLRIEQSTPNTPLYSEQFDGIKQRLARHNQLPDFLHDAHVGGKTFKDVDRRNWPSISCDRGTRFINEAQLRAYLLDFLLEEVKDSRTPLLRECWCYRNGSRTGGRADYFVRVHDVWVPVEAKLNVLAEKNVLGQVAKYTHASSFEPAMGTHRGTTYHGSNSSICLVADQHGLYVIANGEFLNCSPGKPLWQREELDHALTTAIRAHLARVLASFG